MTKKIAQAAHTLEQQLKAFREMVEKRESVSQQAWADTIPEVTEAEAEARLRVMRDKWHREHP
jgi:hypothetical protein